MTRCQTCDHRTCFPCYRQGRPLERSDTMPHFRKGYDERLDLTEDEYLERLWYDSEGEYDHDGDRACEAALAAADDAIEGEPNEDTYLPGIPDYDRFNRPSWGEEE